MSLQGTLDTFALTELVRMLASTNKTGELTIEGDRGLGRLWFVDGALVSGEPSRSGSITDALFELLRFEEGSFSFDADVAAPNPGEPVDAGDALVAAESDLEAWRPVEALVPSSAAVVTLRGELEGDEITIDQTTWRHLVAIGSGTTAGGFGALLDLDDVGAAVRIKELHDAGLVTVDPDAPPPADTPDPVAFAPEPHDELGHLDVAGAGDMADIARDMAEVDAFAAAEHEVAEPVAHDAAPEPLSVLEPVADEAPERFEPVTLVEEPEHQVEVEPALDEPRIDAGLIDSVPRAAATEQHHESPLADVDLGTPGSGSTAVDLDSHLGTAVQGHSYLGTGTGDEVLPEPLLTDAAPEAPSEASAELFAADDAETSWPGPAMDADDLAAQLGALSPAAARAVQAASDGEARSEDDSRGVVRRIISSNRG